MDDLIKLCGVGVVQPLILHLQIYKMQWSLKKNEHRVLFPTKNNNSKYVHVHENNINKAILFEPFDMFIVFCHKRFGYC